MKRILFIAPHAFPIKSSESICNSKVAFALAKAGFIVDVYTCPESNLYPDDSIYDSILRSSENLHIYSIPQRNLFVKTQNLKYKIKSVLSHLKVLFSTGYIYNGITIPYDILKHVESRISKENIKYDYMITRTYFTDLVGMKLSKKYGVKWIANWNDPYPIARFPKPYGKGPNAPISYFEGKMLKAIQKYVSIHTFPNERLCNYMLRYIKVSKKNTRVVPHMAMDLLTLPHVQSQNGSLRMVHCGNVKKPRNPELFIRALANVANSSNYHDFKFDCYFIGTYDKMLPKLIEQLGLNDKVFLLSGKPYYNSMEFLSTCDVSVIIEAVCEEGIYLPTKVVDSFQSGKPIFCVSPTPGHLEDLVSTYRVGYFANNQRIDLIEKQIIRLFEDYANNNLPIINKELLKPFFSEGIIDNYKSIFNDIDLM